MNTTSLTKILILSFCFALIFGCSGTCPKDKVPNILFIMTDDHSLQTFSAYDNRFIETPNLDRIGNEGVVFRNSFVSNSICAPSRAVMLTGKHSHKNGQINNTTTFNGNQVTFPKLLREKGYQTGLIGKWHLKSLPTGFDHYEILIGQGDYYNSKFITNADTIASEGYVTNVITDKSINWLEGRNKEKPFCMLVHHKATHRVWQPDTALFHLYKDEEFEVPETYFDNYEKRPAAAQQKMSIAEDMDLVYDLKLLDKEGEIKTKYRSRYESILKKMTPEQRAAWDREYEPVIADFKAKGLKGDALSLFKYQRYMQDYLRCVASVDNNVGRLLDYLEEQGELDNTLIVYTSDQGFYMGEHGWFDKRFMYEQSLRTPLVMRYPKLIKPKTELHQLVQNIDYAPTFLDLAGIDIPEDIQGESLVKLFNHDNPKWREAIYYHYYEFPNEHMVKRHYGIRTGRYKLIHFYNDIDQWELYDLVNDPNEMLNLCEQEDMQPVTVRLKQQLEQLQMEYDDSDRSTF
ncbi:sulfatase [Labilibacter sediminis]|nr:sulfatase [Labilibacter sediminis]